MQILINVVLPVFLVSGAVALLQPRLRLNGDAVARMGLLIFVPALTLRALLEAEGAIGEMLRVALAVIMVLVILLALSELASRRLHLGRPERGALVSSVVLGNAGAFALPVLVFVFGDAAFLPGMFHVILFNVLLLPLVSVYLAALQQASLGSALQRVARTPVVYAAIVGALIRLGGVTVPEPLLRAIDLIADGTIPLMLVLLGVQLAETFEGGLHLSRIPALGVLVALRLAIAPLAALGAAALLGIEGVARVALVINAGMSTAILAGALARDYAADMPLATLGVLTTTVLSLGTTTLWLNWLL
jgi:predicted permease